MMRPGYTQTPNWRLEDPTLDVYERLVAMWLSSHEAAYLRDEVSLAEVVRRVGVSQRKASTVLDTLAQLGIITTCAGPRGRLVIEFNHAAWKGADRCISAQVTDADVHESSDAHVPTGEQQVEDHQSRATLVHQTRTVDRRKQRADAERARVDQLFESFWRAYPRKVAKPAARRAFAAAIKRGADLSAMGQGLRAWSAYWTARCEPQFIPYPATWLNGDRWNDAPPPVGSKAPGPLSVVQRAWLRRHPGATDDEARAATSSRNDRGQAIEVLAT